MGELSPETIREAVRRRYGDIARDRGANAQCCPSCAPSLSKSERLGYTSEELEALPPGADMGLGSGVPLRVADIRPGHTVVDLGSGGGIDCFLAAGLVGPEGRVIGVDMTEQMVNLARHNATASGFKTVEFRLGRIESLPLPDACADRVVSNCVVNLSPDKPAVLAEVFRVLKPGGRMVISDIVTLAPLPQSVRNDLDKRCGCVAGAANAEEIKGWLDAAGFVDVRVEFASQKDRPADDSAAWVTSAMISATRPAT